jgi:hypothetical protein
MTNALYMTCFNAPAMLQRLLASGMLEQVDRDRWTVILFDQSDQISCQQQYESIASDMQLQRVSNINHGASEAKRAQIEHAYQAGFEIMAQMSEDFMLTPAGVPPVGWLPNGRECFFEAAEEVLNHRAHVAFVQWTFAMGTGSPFWYPHLNRVGKHELIKCSRLAHVEGDVLALGWPYTARVRDMMKLIIDVRQPKHREAMHAADGGETVLAQYSLGKGAALFAQPVIHDRLPQQRPANSHP